MTKLTFFSILGFATSCNSGYNKGHKSDTDNLMKTKFETTEFICDTVYANKGYKITLTKFGTTVPEYDTTYNTIFTLRKNNVLLFSDSIHNAYQDVRFEDFNGDWVKDILVQNMSSAKSNWTYTLYLVDTLNDRLTKVKGFEGIPNPNYLADYDIIDNYVLSGKNWTGFYKIQDDTIIGFDIQIEDDLSDSNLYEQEHKKAIEQIMKKIKNKR